ncbi:Pumilio RNA-binding protein [Hamiltosporidium magnivora]|uniref:Pumilio RNA-binding protein n=1 Tax=Hamiltosporidium magnivora TaxID=148818 RepID=A0A4Q9L8R5_9MICR|nr:Pumilio RNA-binding protein [Hamiltosporidium magnivora]
MSFDKRKSFINKFKQKNDNKNGENDTDFENNVFRVTNRLYNESFNTRCTSAPPVEKMLVEDEHINLEELNNEINYAAYYRRNSRNEPRLPPPNFYMLGQSSFPYGDNSNASLVRGAFSSTSSKAPLLSETVNTISIRKTHAPSLLDRIDEDHPYSEKSSEYKGPSRTTTPIGNAMGFESPTPILASIFSDETYKAPPQAQEDSLLKPLYLGFKEDILKFGIKTSSTQDSPFNKNTEFLYNFDQDFLAKTFCIDLSRDQEGSRFIQKRLEEGTEIERIWFLSQIEEAVLELTTDLFGNYVIQKLFDLCVNRQRQEILQRLKGRIVSLSLHMYGCRVIQKVLDMISPLDDIVEELKGNILGLIEDQNGNHVVQKCVEKVENRDFVIKEFEQHACKLAKHRYGCRVIQRLFEFSINNECSKMINLILENTEDLIENQYGNYVIQHLIEHGRNGERGIIMERVINNSYELSTHKFASNVIEKCIVEGNDLDRIKFLEKFVVKKNDKPLLVTMCMDKFANYVVQRLLEVLDVNSKEKFVECVKPYSVELKRSVYAKHITSKIF